VTNTTSSLFFSKLSRTAWHVNMPGGCTLSAHGVGKLIVKAGGQTKIEKDMFEKAEEWRRQESSSSVHDNFAKKKLSHSPQATQVLKCKSYAPFYAAVPWRLRHLAADSTCPPGPMQPEHASACAHNRNVKSDDLIKPIPTCH
jgi:hypothetical protein